MKTKICTKLTDLLNGLSPKQFGQGLYDATDCGPWINYLIEIVPEKTWKETVRIGNPKVFDDICLFRHCL